MRFSKLAITFLSTSFVVSATFASSNVTTNIVGGEPADDGEYPSYVKANGNLLCGGTLVARDVVLTAAHCSGAFAVGTQLCIGGNKLDCSDAEEKINVAQIRSHPDYKNNIPINLQNDIMLVRLAKGSSQPLWQWNSDADEPEDDETVTAIGFGRTKGFGSLATNLQEVDLEIVSFQDCNTGNNIIDDIMICAWDTGKTVCQGDSGGPLFSVGSNKKIFGIVSFGPTDCASGPAVYTRVSTFNDWIRDNICDLSNFKPAYCNNKNKGNGISCFSHANTVEVQGRGLVSMDSLQIGDYVRAGKNLYSRVYSFLHLDRDIEADYLQIYADGLKAPLEISLEHMLFVKNTPIRASHVKVGDMLGESKVTEIKAVKRRGVYAPATESGDIVVSGALASSYAAVHSYTPINQHTEAHAFFALRRLICTFNFGICESETYTEDGYPHWLAPLIHFAVSTERSVLSQVFASFVGLPLVTAAYILEQMIRRPFLLTGTFLLGLLFAITKTKPSKVNKLQ